MVTTKKNYNTFCKYCEIVSIEVTQIFNQVYNVKCICNFVFEKLMIFIAEIGMNYNGHFPLCYELIKHAKFSGANIVKFQLGWRDKVNEINRIDRKRIKQLIEWSNYFDIELMFSIISDDAFKLINEFKLKCQLGIRKGTKIITIDFWTAWTFVI